MPGPLTMSPLLTALSIWAEVSLSSCLIDGCCCVERWSGSGGCRCPLPALLLGNGRVDTVVGGWVSVLWGRWDVLTALGGSGSLPITDPEPDAARKKCSRLRKSPLEFYASSLRRQEVSKFIWSRDNIKTCGDSIIRTYAFLSAISRLKKVR